MKNRKQPYWLITLAALILIFFNRPVNAYIYNHDDFFAQLYVAIGKGKFIDTEYYIPGRRDAKENRNIGHAESYLLEVKAGFSIIENVLEVINYIIHLGFGVQGNLSSGNKKISYQYKYWHLGILQYFTQYNIAVGIQRRYILSASWKRQRSLETRTLFVPNTQQLFMSDASQLEGGDGWGFSISKEKWIGMETSLGIMLSLHFDKLRVHNPYSDISVFDTLFSHQLYAIGVCLVYD